MNGWDISTFPNAFGQPIDSKKAHDQRVITHTKETLMRRDSFLKSMAALAAAGALPLSALAAANVKMMIPANPGGGWDTTGRALGKAMVESGAASTVTYDNKGGAAGALGLAQFVNGSKGDGNALMVMGAVMLGGLITGKPPVSLSQATPIARLTSEYNVFEIGRAHV